MRKKKDATPAGFLAAGALWLGLVLAPAGPALADVLRVGVQDNAVPFAYRTVDGEAVGYSVDLCRRVAARLAAATGRDVSLMFVAVSSKTRLARLLAAEIDIECGSTSSTEGRRALGLAFSRPIFLSDVAVLLAPTPDGVPAAPAAWLREAAQRPLPVVTTAGSTSVRHLATLRESTLDAAGLRVEYGLDHDDSMRRVLEGRASAFVMDRVLLAARLAWAEPTDNPGDVAQLAPWSLLPQASECYSLVMRADDEGLRQAVDAVIDELLVGAAFAALYARWFTEPIPAPRSLVRAGADRPRALALPYPPRLRERLADPAGRVCEDSAGSTTVSGR